MASAESNPTASAGTKRSLFWFHMGALLTVMAWGVSFVSTKVLLVNGLSPVEAYVYRFTLAYLMVLLICHRKFRSNSLRDELLFLTCGVCGGSIYFIAENMALEYTLVSNVSLITTLSPLLATLMLGALYKSERPTAGVIGGSLIAFLGVGFVIFNSSLESSTAIEINPFGDLLALGAAVTFAIYSLVLRRLNALYSTLYITRKTFFYGVLTALPFLALEPELASPKILLELPVWFNLLFLGVFASLIAFLLWAESIKRLGTVTASNYLYFQPVVTLIASAFILHEQVTIVGYTGCALILFGVWLSDYLGRRGSLKR